ncbi:immunoglobulin-like and fibronectin type III domain-containing protein 1 [Melopsittacus undulatus]|uniref:immunoglobulin-like and fibronectin type III domain-containing protein 1 n=1 Tax=Melopsittacus undulatus TaxID=13146 RepID=UPI00146F8896|nr:immunoglobulin-like and fibronectin type III domain-containing protein 1 [Melopsittacus undulatus]
MTSRQEVKPLKKSSVPGVLITQFVDDVPEGCSTPDFERKPVSLTLEEGKNAIFRAVVKGVPAPDVKWTRAQGGMDDPAKYEIFFNSVTNEFILQINKLTVKDSDLYRCFAVNEYGEASCSAGLRIIQVGFKRKAKYVPVHAADELRKTLEDSRKRLRKRAPAPKPKPLDKEAVWQLLLHADKRDYERICIKYGIADFRGMLKKLQEMRKDAESEQGELIHSIKNFKHIEVTKDGKAMFSLEMDLKNTKSKVYLLKDGEKLRYETSNEYGKHCLRQIGKKYIFIVNDVQQEDAGLYQVRVEDVPVFSTALDPDSIPVGFEQPLGNTRCLENEDVIFKCVLRTPCHDAVWLHKNNVLEASEKHQISVSPDGLTHQLTIKNSVPSDNGMYTIDTGLSTSNAWLIVEYAKGKGRPGEGEENSEWLEESLPKRDWAKKLRQQEPVGDGDHLMDTGEEKRGWYRNGQGGSQGHSVDADGSQRFLGKDGLRRANRNESMGGGQFSEADLDGDTMASDGSIFGLKGFGGKRGLRPLQGKDSMADRADTGDESGAVGEWISVDGRGGVILRHVDVDMADGEGVGFQHDRDGKLDDTSYRAGFGGFGRSRAAGGSSEVDGLDLDSAGVGDGMRSPYGKDGLPTVDRDGTGINTEGQIGIPYGEDGLAPHARSRLGQTGKSGLLYGPGGPSVGDGAIPGAGGSSVGEIEALYGPGGWPLRQGAGVAGAGGVGSPYGKDGLPVGAALGGAGVAGAGGVGSPYGKDGVPVGAALGGAGVGGAGGVGSPYGKDGVPVGAGFGGAGVAGAGGVGSPYGKDGVPVGAALGGAGVAGAGGVGSPYGKDGVPVGAGFGGAGVAGARGVGSPYGKDGLPVGAGFGGAGVADAGGVGSPYGKDGVPVGAGFGGAGVAGARGVGSPYGKDGVPVGAGFGGAGVAGAGGVGSPYGKDGVPVGAGFGGAGVTGAGGVGSPYGKDGVPVGAGFGGAGVAGAGGVGSPYGKDGVPVGAALGGAGVAGAGGVGSPYGKDGVPVGAALGGAGVGGAGGVGSPYGKDGVPVGAGFGGAGVAGAGGVGSPYGKDGVPVGAALGGAGVAGVGGVGSPYGKDGFPAGAGIDGAGVASAGGVGSPYGKDGVPVGAGFGGAGVAGAGGVGSPYGKDGLPVGAALGGAGVAGAGGVGSPYGKDGVPVGAGIGAAGVAGAGGVGSPYGKDGVPVGAALGAAGVAGAGGFGSPYGKDGLPVGVGIGAAGVAGAGGVGSPCGKDGVPVGAGFGGAGVAGAGGVGSPYGKDGVPVGAGIGAAGVAALGGAGVAGAGGVGSPYGKDGVPVGAALGGAGVAGAGGVGSPYGKDGVPVGAALGGAGVSGAGGVGSPYGKDGLPAGAGIGDAGVAGAGGVGSPYGKDGVPVGAGIGAAGVAGAGGVGSPYGKDGVPVGAGIGAAGVAGAGGVGSPYGKDGVPVGTGIGAAGVAGVGGAGIPYGQDGLPVGGSFGGAGVAGVGGVGSPYGKAGIPPGGVGGSGHFPLGGAGIMGSHHGSDSVPSKAAGYAGGAGNVFSSERGGMGGSALRDTGSPYGKDSVSAGARAGVDDTGSLRGDGKGSRSVGGKEAVVGADERGGEYGLDSRPGKPSTGRETGKGTASDFRSGSKASDDRGSLSGQRAARGGDRDLGQLRSLHGTKSTFRGAGSKSLNRFVGGMSSGSFGQGSLDYGQMSAHYGGLPSINLRKEEPSLDFKTNDFLKSIESVEKRRQYCLDDLRAPRCHVNKQLLNVRVLKGEPAELSCTVSKEGVIGTWFKDGLKLTSMEGVCFKQEGLVHKLIIDKVEDIHAGKYRFESGDIKTEASIFVEDPPQVDKVLLKNLTSVPTVAKAGQNVTIKIPFEGRLPIRAAWLKDKMELADDTRIRVDKTDTFTKLSISNSERKDAGDYKVRLKNDSGVLEINLKLVVFDKPQPPIGPIKIVESSANDITIQWKPPKDDGGKPVQSYIIERQQVGKDEWVTLGETPKSCTTFTTNKVEQDMSYYFRVRAVNAEGTSDALESEEVKAVSKATPGAPDPPEIVSASRDTITISWKAPQKSGSSRIVGYLVQKRKKGTMTWLPVNNVPIADKKLEMTNLKKGLQYEFRVAAVNAAGTGDASEPSKPVFARDSTKSLGQVQDLKVSSSDSSSITLTWKRPETSDGSDVKGYEVEVRSSNNLNWTKCNVLPIETTTYTVKGLQAKEIYFLRVRALSDSGPGEAAELEALLGPAPPVVPPRLLIDDTVKSLLVIKAGNIIRVNIPFEGSPAPVVTWLKDGRPLPSQAKIKTQDDTTQLLIGAAEFTDSGTYTVELQNGLGKRETFSFQVQVTDIPLSPGPIQLQENVQNTVTVTWEPSASEKWERDLYYTVLKRESQKGIWRVVGDLIYTNKFTFTRLIPGRDYYFRVVAKNNLGTSGPSETVQPWRIRKPKAEFYIKPQKYKGVNQNQPPRFLVPLKPHVVTTGSECHMSCAVGGHPAPKIRWYKDSRDLSNDPTYFCTNDFGVCSLVVLGVTKQDEGEYMVEATNELGRAFSRAFLTIKDSTL